MRIEESFAGEAGIKLQSSRAPATLGDDVASSSHALLEINRGERFFFSLVGMQQSADAPMQLQLDTCYPSSHESGSSRKLLVAEMWHLWRLQ